MSLHSGAMSDHNLLTWLQDRLVPTATSWQKQERQLPLSLSSLLDELIDNVQYSSRAVLLQTLLDAQHHLMLKGSLHTPISTESSAVILQAIEGLLLNRHLDHNITILLELLPEELQQEYRQLLLNEADALADEFAQSDTPAAEARVTAEEPLTWPVADGEVTVEQAGVLAQPAAVTPEGTAWPEATMTEATRSEEPAQSGLPANLASDSACTPLPTESSGAVATTLVTSKLASDHPLLLVIDMAREDIAPLTVHSATEWQDRLDQIREHLENIAFTADSCGLEAFALLFHKKAEQLQQEAGDDPATLQQRLDQLVEFLTAARLQADSLVASAASDVEATPHDLSEPAPSSAPPLPSASSEVSYSDSRLAILAEELQDIEPELIALAGTLVKERDEALFQPLERYGDLMSRLMLVCDELGMEGLKRVIIAISDNINLLPTLDAQARLLSLSQFVGWPTMVERYLRNPADEAGVIELVDFLQAVEWPAPLSGLDSRDLFALLVEGPSVEQQSADTPQRAMEVTTEDVSLQFDPDVNRDLFESFLIEAPDLARQFNATITHLGSGSELLDNLRTAQRMSHTLKGSANLIGIKGIANLAHHTEDILETLARTRTTPPEALREALARSGDCLEGMIDAVHGLDAAPDDALEVLQHVLEWAHLADRGEFDKMPPATTPHSPAAASEPSASPAAGEAPQAGTAAADALSSVRVSSTTIDDMFRLVEEITISQGQIREQVSRLKKLGDVLASHEQILQGKRFNLENLVDIRSIASMQRKAHRQRILKDEFDPLEMDQYDELHTATHSYIEAVADARELNQFVINNISQLDSLLLRQDRLNKELQQIVGATRLVPVSVITSRLERAIRQACRMTHKQASLVIIGRQFLIDGDILNKLVDPLLHMLRNAVDHGIEFPDERLEKGKPPSGTITLEFRQEGNNIAVSCRDDGRGLDYARIAEVAQQKGLLQHAQQASHEQLGQLILTPAFTTRSSATQLSGRGIGMDAVQAAVTALKGNIVISDPDGGGTEFVMRIPTSLVTNHSLIVRCGSERFAIPTGYLQQILPPGSGRITLYGDTETFQLGNAYYPLHSLNTLLGIADEAPKESKTVLITSGSGRTASAIAVDYVLQSAELVVKGLGKYVHHVPGSIGVSVLGDGQVIPVLDLAQLIKFERIHQPGNIIDGQLSQAALDDTGLRRPAVLIVDDSLSVRNNLSQLLGDFGYRTQTARDGVEALELVRKQAPAIVLTDLEMPRMDGMELVRALRSSSETGALPIVMITSRTQAKHRSAAEQAGISAYVTKPFIEEELLDTVSSLLENHA
ncbi:MAG TPA: response regulator [Gammaproteobacteria bacterium]